MPGGPTGAEAVAGKIKQDEADAKARVAAVEYLATVDCSRWTEATEALKNALRKDHNECVRFAAARALNSGCCCSQEIIDALRNCLADVPKDGAPPESSPRVKAAAFSALQNCLMRVPEVLPEVPVREPELPRREVAPPPPPAIPAVPPEREKPPTSMSGPVPTHVIAAHFRETPRAPMYEEQLRHKSFAQTLDEARQTLFEVAQKPAQPVVLPPGKQSVWHALVKARQDLNTQGRTPPPTPRYPMPPTPRGSGLQQTSYTSPPAPAVRRDNLTPAAAPKRRRSPVKASTTDPDYLPPLPGEAVKRDSGASASMARRSLFGSLLPAKRTDDQ
jgi:hypothetical protein